MQNRPGLGADSWRRAAAGWRRSPAACPCEAVWALALDGAAMHLAASRRCRQRLALARRARSVGDSRFLASLIYLY